MRPALVTLFVIAVIGKPMPFSETPIHDTGQYDPDANADMETGFVLTFDESGVLFEYPDACFVSLYQNQVQIKDLIAKLQRAIA
jgi:hypothetical protein